jgi:dihydroorotase
VDATNQGQMVDLLLKNGHVIDPVNGRNGVMDVAVLDGKIANVTADIDPATATRVVDVMGYLVTPGLLDIHTHVYQFISDDAYVGGMHADAHLLASGVTTTVDAGTTGWKDFSDFVEHTITKSKVRILALVNIAAGGMVSASSEQKIHDMQPAVVAALVDAYPDICVGIKSAHYWTKDPFDAEHPPWASVDKALEAGELCGKPVMVDFWPRPPERSYQDLILHKLRPGDIHTHVFAQQFPIIDENGKVYPHMFQAQERGVIFDLGHGAGSFWFRNGVPALQGGFYPNSISTDLHMGNINGPVVSMITTMSKLLSIGLPLQEVIMRSTAAPAREIGRQDLGNLSVGAGADIAVIQHQHGSFGYSDCGRAKMVGTEKLECAMTIRAGNIVYDPTGISMPEWHNAPEAYWQLRH